MFDFFKRNKWVCNPLNGFKKEEISARKYSRNRVNVLAENLKELAKIFKKDELNESIRVMEESNALLPSLSKKKWLAFRYYEKGDIITSHSYIVELDDNIDLNESERRRIDKIENDYKKKIKEISENDILKGNVEKLAKEIASLKKIICCIYDDYNNNKNQRIPSNDRINLGCSGLKRKNHTNDDYWFQTHKELIDGIDVSNGIRYYEKFKTKIGIICDEFFYESVEDAAHFVYLTPNNYMEKITNNDIEVLLFVTTWRGLQQEWRGLATTNPKVISDIRKSALSCIKECKIRNIPTIFFSKEDPPNYLVFLDYAKECDYIFTTALECVDFYKSDCQNKNVDVLPFGINPRFHNPVNLNRNKCRDTVLFSGSWMKKYPKRCHDFITIADGVLSTENALVLIDRNFNNKNYAYPEQYQPYVIPSIDHKILQKVHKLSTWSININTVTNSETMFANRAYELLAGGSLLLSNYSIGMNTILPNINIASSSSDVKNILSMREEYVYEKQVFNIRTVMTCNTCFERIGKVLNVVGIKTNSNDLLKKVLVVAKSIDTLVKKSFDIQTYSERFLIEEKHLTSELIRNFDIITWFSPEYFYEEFYLEDLCNAFKYVDVDFITKPDPCDKPVINNHHCFVNNFKSIYTTIFWIRSFDINEILKFHFVSNKGYLVDHLNILPYSFFDKTISNSNFKVSVVVPVYNNGHSLYGKCFDSLRRSSIFDYMEVIMVDDGSSDEYTLSLLNYLERHYKNVKVFRFEKGGSGSASRPRNMGVKLSSAPYVTFLDPDNEAINDGYSNLYNELSSSNDDIVVGNMLKYNNEQKRFDYYNTVLSTLGKTYFNDGLDKCLPMVNFFAPSIQAMLIKASFLKNLKFEQVEGAIGQDTLFSWQLLCSRCMIKFVNLDIHIYYAANNGSVTNEHSPSFYHKLLKIQQSKYDWLNRNGMLVSYMDKKYNYYTHNWILKHLSQCNIANYEKCTDLTFEMLKIFNSNYDYKDDLINSFLDLYISGNIRGSYELVKKYFDKKVKIPYLSYDELFKSKEILLTKNKNANFSGYYNLEIENSNLYININKSGNEKISFVILNNYTGYSVSRQYLLMESSSINLNLNSLNPGKYRIRVFKHIENGKLSEDVIFFIKHAYKIFIDEKYSLLQKECNFNKFEIDLVTNDSSFDINVKSNSTHKYCLVLNEYNNGIVKKIKWTSYSLCPTLSITFDELTTDTCFVKLFEISNDNSKKQSQNIYRIDNYKNIVSLF